MRPHWQISSTLERAFLRVTNICRFFHIELRLRCYHFGWRREQTLLSLPDVSIWRLANTIESQALRNYESFYASCGLIPGQGSLSDIVESCAGIEGWACAVLPSVTETHGQIDKYAGATNQNVKALENVLSLAHEALCKVEGTRPNFFS